MKKYIKLFAAFILFMGVITQSVYAAPSYRVEGTLIPFNTVQDLGSTTLRAWRNIVGQNIIATSTSGTSSFAGNVTIGNGSLNIGTTIPLQLNGFGSGYVRIQTSTSSNDVEQWQLNNNSAGTSATGCIFFGNNKTPTGTIGAINNYYGGTCFAGSNYNIPGFNALRPNGIALFATDGPLTLGSGSANSASSSIYFQAGSGLDASYDGILQGGTGNFGVGTTSPGTKLGIQGDGLFAGVISSSSFISTSTTATSTIGTGGFTVGGTKLIVQQTSGNVGIGTTSPSYLLSITGKTTSTGVSFATANSSNIQKFTVLDNGNVGIGTTSPAYPLSVGGGGISGKILINGQSATYSVALDDTSGDFFIYQTGANTQFDHMINGATVMHITSAGNTGFGTTSPGTFLETQCSSSITNLVTLNPCGISVVNSNTTVNTVSEVALRGFDTNLTRVTGAKIDAIFTDKTPGASSGDFAVSTMNAGTISEKIRVKSNGNIGIGTTTPTTPVQVNQTAATSTIYASVVNSSGVHSTTLGGKIVLQDVAGGTCTEITAQSGVLTAKAITCP